MKTCPMTMLMEILKMKRKDPCKTKYIKTNIENTRDDRLLRDIDPGKIEFYIILSNIANIYRITELKNFQRSILYRIYVTSKYYSFVGLNQLFSNTSSIHKANVHRLHFVSFIIKTLTITHIFIECLYKLIFLTDVPGFSIIVVY